MTVDYFCLVVRNHFEFFDFLKIDLKNKISILDLLVFVILAYISRTMDGGHFNPISKILGTESEAQQQLGNKIWKLSLGELYSFVANTVFSKSNRSKGFRFIFTVVQGMGNILLQRNYLDINSKK